MGQSKVRALGKKLFLSLLVLVQRLLNHLEGEQTVGRVGGVLLVVVSWTYTAFPLDVLNGRKWGPSDALGSFHHLMEPFAACDRAAYQTVTQLRGEDTLDRTPVEVLQYR